MPLPFVTNLASRRCRICGSRKCRGRKSPFADQTWSTERQQSQPRAKPVRKTESARPNPAPRHFVEGHQEIKNRKRTVYWLEGGKLCSREDVSGWTIAKPGSPS